MYSVARARTVSAFDVGGVRVVVVGIICAEAVLASRASVKGVSSGARRGPPAWGVERVMAVRVVAPGLSTVARKGKGKLCCRRFTVVTTGIRSAKREFLPCRQGHARLAAGLIGREAAPGADGPWPTGGRQA